MNILIMATKGCSHCKNLSRELEDIGVDYQVVYCDDNPGLVKKYGIRHSPVLIVNGEVVFKNQPSEAELREYFNG